MRKPSRTDVGIPGPDDPGAVSGIEPIEVDGDEVPDSETSQVLVEERAGTSGSDYSDLLGGQDFLPSLSEQADLSVVLGVCVPRPSRRRIQSMLGATDDHGVVEFDLTVS